MIDFLLYTACVSAFIIYCAWYTTMAFIMLMAVAAINNIYCLGCIEGYTKDTDPLWYKLFWFWL